VLSGAGGQYRIHSLGEILDATLRGRLKQRGRRRVLVGDAVTVVRRSDGSATIEEVLPRRSILKRRSPGRSRGTRTVAANVDQVIVVGSLDRPPWDPHLMDRFIAVAEANDLPSIVVVNKCDLGADGETCATPYRRAGYPVVLTSVPQCSGIERLRGHLEGCTSLFTGPTGVGKSSLLNVLEPGLRLRTEAVSRKSGAGRHTTVAAEMYPLGACGYVVDTPGLRDIGLWGLEPLEVARAFPELVAFASECRFDDCRHLEEPGCAVTGAVVTGSLAASRRDSYRRLLREALEAARPWA
jgi:ribosome biogenesis GTPase